MADLIRIFIIEDHPVTITGLHYFFRPSRDLIQVTGSAPDLNTALTQANPATFDVIFLDLWLPGENPTENFKKLSRKYPGKPIIVYSAENSIHWQRKMFKAGVKAFISKQATKTEIQQVLERVIKGETVYTAFVKDFQAKRTIDCYEDSKYGLKEGQKEILKHFIEGIPPRTIATMLDKNISSIERALRKARKVFMADNNVGLIKTLMELDNEFFNEDQPAGLSHIYTSTEQVCE